MVVNGCKQVLNVIWPSDAIVTSDALRAYVALHPRMVLPTQVHPCLSIEISQDVCLYKCMRKQEPSPNDQAMHRSPLHFMRCATALIFCSRGCKTPRKVANHVYIEGEANIQAIAHVSASLFAYTWVETTFICMYICKCIHVYACTYTYICRYV